MTTIPITLAAAGILGLIYLVLTGNVVRRRVKSKVMLGDGTDNPGSEPFRVEIRAHGNFAEYVPLALILLGGIEAAGAGRFFCLLLAAMLIVGRILHPFGLARPTPNALRAAGSMLTWIMIGLASLEALYIAL